MLGRSTSFAAMQPNTYYGFGLDAQDASSAQHSAQETESLQMNPLSFFNAKEVAGVLSGGSTFRTPDLPAYLESSIPDQPIPEPGEFPDRPLSAPAALGLSAWAFPEEAPRPPALLSYPNTPPIPEPGEFFDASSPFQYGLELPSSGRSSSVLSRTSAAASATLLPVPDLDSISPPPIIPQSKVPVSHSGAASATKSSQSKKRRKKKCNSEIDKKTDSVKHSKSQRKSKSKERCFKCLNCDYQTFAKRNFDRHTKIHTGERPFECSKCEYTTSRIDSLRDHVKIHSDNKDLTCPDCDYATCDRRNFYRHRKIHES